MQLLGAIFKLHDLLDLLLDVLEGKGPFGGGEGRLLLLSLLGLLLIVLLLDGLALGVQRLGLGVFTRRVVNQKLQGIAG